MKHTIIILAHKNLQHVIRLIEYFEKACSVIVHIDKKVKVPSEIMEKIAKYPQVVGVYQQHNVNWGGFNMLKCEIDMIYCAINATNSNYIHLISGQDYPVRPLDSFLNFFENKDDDFIQYTHLPNPCWEDNTYRRFQYYYPYDIAADQKRPKLWVLEQVKEQQKRGIKRPIPDEFDHLYGGSQWFSITRASACTLLDYTKKNPNLYNRMWMTFAPEESYVATVLVNLTEKGKVIGSNYRYIRWKNENGNRPANLGPEHFYYLLEQDYLFARKFEYPVSEPLLHLIDTYLLKDSDLVVMQNGGWKYNGYLKYQYNAQFKDFIIRFCMDVCVQTAVDIGCGSGYYVSSWRRAGLHFDGYDANPYTPLLSTHLLESGESPCNTADLVSDIEGLRTYELAVCKDVLTYIPNESLKQAVRNLCRISSHYIIVCNIENDSTYPIQNDVNLDTITSMMSIYGYEEEEYMTARLKVVLRDANESIIYKKNNSSILIKHTPVQEINSLY